MLHASPAFLPSSSAMVLLTLAHAAWLDEIGPRGNAGGRDTNGGFARAILAVAAASVLCWPFACVGGATLALGALSRLGLPSFTARAALAGIGCLLSAIAVDSYYYGRRALAAAPSARERARAVGPSHASALCFLRAG